MSCSINVSASKVLNQSNGRKFYSVESDDCTYLDDNNSGVMNRQNYKTYYLQFTKNKIRMTTTVIAEHMSMNCSILICINQNNCFIINVKNTTYHF